MARRRKEPNERTAKSEPVHYDPLSQHDVFAGWAMGRPWSNGTVSFGAVVADLVAGVTDFALHPRRDTWRRWEQSVALGCVPWMSNEQMTTALASLSATCIVMNKGAGDQRGARALLEGGNPIPAHYLRGFDEMGRPEADGTRPVMTPAGLTTETVEEFGPVRAAGWRGGRKAPLLHAKLLVLGDGIGWDDDEGPDFGVHHKFEPRKAWLGSANWTDGATNHLEFGLWTTDPQLVQATYQFVLDVIAFSEPFDTTHDDPMPEVVSARWDDAAFAEAAAEWNQAVREDHADEDDADDT